MDTTTLDPGRESRPDTSSGSVGGSFERAWSEVREMLRGHATLAVLEAQRAGISFLVIVGIALATTMLAVTAWLALLTGVMVWLGGERLGWPAILFVVALLNVVMAGILALVARSYLTELPFSATLRQLRADVQAGGAMRRLSELSREIDECEQDVIAHRERLSGALSESSRGMRRGATSPGMLLGTVLAGFIVGRLTLRPEPPSGGTAPAVAKGAGAVGLLSGLAWAVVRGQLATPDSGLNRWLHERMQRGRGPADASMPRGNGADGAVARDGVAGARGGGFRH